MIDARDHRLGATLCLASAVAFGLLAVFGKLAFDAGVGVITLLFVRFAFAAPILWAAALRRRRTLLAGTAAKTVLAALALGAVGYAMQAGLYFAALERMDASLLSLLLYTYPAFVTVAAIALGRETANRRRVSSPRPASRWSWRERAAAASTGSAPRWASAPRSATPPTSSCPTASAAGSTRCRCRRS
jgi:uncharacterized membrane protein